MQLMDCHVHIAALNQRDLQLMTISNVKSVVAHIAEPDVATNIPWTATFDFVDRMLDFHTWRAAKYYITFMYAPVSRWLASRSSGRRPWHGCRRA